MINGQEYAFEDLEIVMNGVPLTGFEAIEYTVKKEKVNVIGRGNRPVARARGTKDYEASITLHQSQLEAIQATLPRGKDLTDIKPFTIVVAYAPEGGVLVTDVLEFVEFTEVKKSMKTSEANMVVELPLIVGNINFNGAKNI